MGAPSGEVVELSNGTGERLSRGGVVVARA